MKKILSIISLAIASTVFAQREPLFRPFDISAFGGGYLFSSLDLQQQDWKMLNPDEPATIPGSDGYYQSAQYRRPALQGGMYRNLQVQFAIRKNNEARKGLWLAGISLGASSSRYASNDWNNTSPAYLLDTVSVNGMSPQYLMTDTMNYGFRELNVNSVHLGFSIGYATNPAKLFSFKIRALIDVSVSGRSQAIYTNNTIAQLGLLYDTINTRDKLNIGAGTYSNPSFSSYSTKSIVGFGIQIPVGISWQLSSFRPILSRFSVGLEGAGGIRLINIPGAGTYSRPTFTMGANLAYRFKTWIPDNNNIRKIREKQKMEGLR